MPLGLTQTPTASGTNITLILPSIHPRRMIAHLADEGRDVHPFADHRLLVGEDLFLDPVEGLVKVADDLLAANHRPDAAEHEVRGTGELADFASLTAQPN
jgi:hypothetical protein